MFSDSIAIVEDVVIDTVGHALRTGDVQASCPGPATQRLWRDSTHRRWWSWANGTDADERVYKPLMGTVREHLHYPGVSTLNTTVLSQP